MSPDYDAPGSAEYAEGNGQRGRRTRPMTEPTPDNREAAPRYDGHEFYEDSSPREPGLCDYTMPDGDWCGQPPSFHWHNREAAPGEGLDVERLREALRSFLTERGEYRGISPDRLAAEYDRLDR